MYGCLDDVRKNLNQIITRLFEEIPHLRIGVLAHGDYCDKDLYYCMRWIDFCTDTASITNFVSSVGQTGGGDPRECYELVLHNAARAFNWSKDCRFRSVVLIGDENPHTLETNNPHGIDWREKAKDCKACGIKVYGIHCRGVTHSKAFYEEIAKITDGMYFPLAKLQSFAGLMVAI